MGKCTQGLDALYANGFTDYNIAYKICPKTYLTFALNAYIQTAEPTSRAILHPLRQLRHHHRFLIRLIICGRLGRRLTTTMHDAPLVRAIVQSVTTARQRTRLRVVVVRLPFVQLAIVGHLVEGGALVRSEVLQVGACLRARTQIALAASTELMLSGQSTYLHVTQTIPDRFAAAAVGRMAPAQLLGHAAVARSRARRPLGPPGPAVLGALLPEHKPRDQPRIEYPYKRNVPYL